jgi:multidrug efflux pump subunit AcrA (membrane-fusion protein)
VAHSRILRTGRSDGNWIEVVEGLEPGDRIVYDGHFALEDGSMVEIDGAAAPVGAE